MVKPELERRIRQALDDPQATEKDRLLAEAILDAFQGVGRGYANMQWATNQLYKIAQHVGVTLDPPPQ